MSSTFEIDPSAPNTSTFPVSSAEAAQGGSTRDVIVVDLSESPRTRVIIWAIAKGAAAVAAFSATLRRMFGEQIGIPIVLLISPGGSAGLSQFAGGTDVQTPDQLLNLDEYADEAQRAIYAAAIAIESGPNSSLFPTEHGISLATLSRTVTIAYLRNALILLRALDEICANNVVGSITVVSADPAIASGARLLAADRNARCLTFIPPILSLCHQGVAACKRVVSRPESAADSQSAAVGRAAGNTTDALIISESTPMLRMFEVVERFIRESRPEVALTRVQYGNLAELNPVEYRPKVVQLGRPDERVAAGSRYRKSGVPDSPQARAATIRTEVLGRHVTLPLHELIARSYLGLFDRQAEHLVEVERILDSTGAKVLVVGNDRWWIGQAFVRVAQRRALPHLMLQDGIANHGAEWFFSVADTMALSSSFLIDRLLPDPGRNPVATVVGQPRYDAAPVRSRVGEPGGGSGGQRTTRRRILFATQTMQDFQFVKSVVDALLQVDGAEITIRPHPSEDSRGHLRLAEIHAPRVSFSAGGRSFDSLADCDLLVCQSSTVVLEAALLGIPAITVNFTGLPDLSPYAKMGLAENVNTPQLLTRAVAALLTDDESYIRKQQRLREEERLNVMLGPVDGRSGERAAEVILRMLDGAKLPASASHGDGPVAELLLTRSSPETV